MHLLQVKITESKIMKRFIKSILRNCYIGLALLSKIFSRENLYDWLSVEVYKLKPGSVVLNIGASGKMDELIRGNKELNIISIDIDPDKNPDIVMDATELTFENNHFDAVFMMEVLEHVKTPHMAVNEIERVLKKDGTFIMSTPFVFGIHEEPYDFFRFTKYGLKHLFINFTDVELRARNGYYGSIVVLFMRSIFSPGKLQQAIGGLLIIIGFPFFLSLVLLDRLVKDDRATTGYFVTCKKS